MIFKKEYLFGLIPIALFFLKDIFDKKTLIVGGKKVKTGYKDVLYYRKIAEHYGNLYNIPYEILLSIMAQESMGFNYTKKGSSGEIGLMQITPVGLAYAETNYSIEQMAIPEKSLEVASIHLSKDFDYLEGSLENAIMAYNISRRHIKNILNETATEKNKRMVKTKGKDYLSKIFKHKKVILPLLLNPEIDDETSDNYIKYELYP